MALVDLKFSKMTLGDEVEISAAPGEAGFWKETLTRKEWFKPASAAAVKQRTSRSARLSKLSKLVELGQFGTTQLQSGSFSERR